MGRLVCSDYGPGLTHHSPAHLNIKLKLFLNSSNFYLNSRVSSINQISSFSVSNSLSIENMKNSNRNSNNGGDNQKSNFLAPKVNTNKLKKNKSRLGGGGLSLQAFANAKSKNDGYNPAIIKKQREFYKNAKCVNKYKKSLKQPNQEPSFSRATNFKEDKSENQEGGETSQWKQKKGKKIAYSLEVIYNKKREEEEKARMEKEAIIKSKKEEKEKSEARRKAKRENMFKRTRSGQPIMKYRIEHLLQTIQGSKD